MELDMGFNRIFMGLKYSWDMNLDVGGDIMAVTGIQPSTVTKKGYMMGT